MEERTEMTAKEIREMLKGNLRERVGESLDVDALQAFFLAEIAVQLAELNEKVDRHVRVHG
jgi:hypothetical protein